MGNRLDIFVDGEYYNAIQRHFALSFDFPRFIDAVRRTLEDKVQLELEISHTFFYDCLPPPADQQRYAKKLSFLNFLKTLRGVRVREGYVVSRGLGLQQKQVDMLIGLDMAKEGTKGLVSHMVLVSGDGDLCPAVETAGSNSAQVWLFYSAFSYSDLLWNTADGRHEIDEEFARGASRGKLSKADEVALGGE